MSKLTHKQAWDLMKEGKQVFGPDGERWGLLSTNALKYASPPFYHWMTSDTWQFMDRDYFTEEKQETPPDSDLEERIIKRVADAAKEAGYKMMDNPEKLFWSQFFIWELEKK